MGHFSVEIMRLLGQLSVEINNLKTLADPFPVDWVSQRRHFSAEVENG